MQTLVALASEVLHFQRASQRSGGRRIERCDAGERRILDKRDGEKRRSRLGGIASV